MIIDKIVPHHIRIPYDAGVASFKQGASSIATIEIVLIEVTTDTGLTGWGDAWAYVCSEATVAAVRQMIVPQAVGQAVPTAAEIPAFMERMQKNLHLFGRYGVTMFAISGLDIALWDLSGKIAGKPLCEMFGSRRREAIPAYASLLRIGDPKLVAGECKAALAKGYGAIKLHETTLPAVAAARDAIGPDIPLMVDMNCPMDAAEAIEFAIACRPLAPKFLEEPVWPPEDFRALARVQATGGLMLAAGENACTAFQFREMFEQNAVSYAQPSIIKVGGVTEYWRAARLADRYNVRLAPHSPYFGPGLLATLHMMSLRDDKTFVEIFYMNREACLWGDALALDSRGAIRVPTGHGLGLEPDRRVIERYRVS
jgi:L-alanine-DL-glutamate epimerase-like enolase superfamily enzyme